MEAQAIKQFAKGFISKGEVASAARKKMVSNIGDAALDGLTSGSFKVAGISAAAGGVVGAVTDDDSPVGGFFKGAVTGGALYAGIKSAQGIYANKEVLLDNAHNIQDIAKNVAKTAPGNASAMSAAADDMTAGMAEYIDYVQGLV